MVMTSEGVMTPCDAAEASAALEAVSILSSVLPPAPPESSSSTGAVSSAHR